VLSAWMWTSASTSISRGARARCPYCDFAIAVPRGHDLGRIPHARYADAVLAELAARAPLFAGRRLRSIYFGGGTPSLWDPRRHRPASSPPCARASPTACPTRSPSRPTRSTACLPCLDALLAAGATRLSIGAQSFENRELVFLGRDHDGRHRRRLRRRRPRRRVRVHLARPHLRPQRAHPRGLRRSLDRAVALAPEHLSVYQLTSSRVRPSGPRRAPAARSPPTTTWRRRSSSWRTPASRRRLRALRGLLVRAARDTARRHNSLYWTGRRLPRAGQRRPLAPPPPRRRGAPMGRPPLRSSATSPARPPPTHAPAAWWRRPPRRTLAPCAPTASGSGCAPADGIPASWSAIPAPSPRSPPPASSSVDEDRVRPTARGLLFADELGARLLE
jgi:hypothetical protein